MYRKSIKAKGFLNQFYFIYYSIFKSFVFSLNFLAIGNKNYFIQAFKTNEDYTSGLYIHGSNMKYDVPSELYKGDTRSNTFSSKGNYGKVIE